MAYEPDIIAKWLVQKLEKDQALIDLGFGRGRVYRDRALQGAPTPYIVFSMQSGGTDDNTGGARNYAQPLFLVKIVSTPLDNENVGDALNRIEAILDSTQDQTNGYLLTCKGNAPYELPEFGANSQEYNHRGRLWRFFVSAM